jgi:hypothetical protein
LLRANASSSRSKSVNNVHLFGHGLRTPREEIAFTARPKIQSQSQIFKYGRSIFCLPHRPNFSDIFDLCLHWVSVVRVFGGRSNPMIYFRQPGNSIKMMMLFWPSLLFPLSILHNRAKYLMNLKFQKILDRENAISVAVLCSIHSFLFCWSFCLLQYILYYMQV